MFPDIFTDIQAYIWTLEFYSIDISRKQGIQLQK